MSTCLRYQVHACFGECLVRAAHSVIFCVSHGETERNTERDTEIDREIDREREKERERER